MKNVLCRVSSGDICVFPSNNVEKCGNIISQAPDRARACQAAEDAVRGIVVRLEAETLETEAFLAGEGELIPNPDGSTWPPLAFDLPPDLAAVIASLPEGLPLGIDSLPRSGAFGTLGLRDWSGRSFMESARMALDIAGFPGPEGANPASPGLSGRFWRALARAGVQGGLYVLDTEEARSARR